MPTTAEYADTKTAAGIINRHRSWFTKNRHEIRSVKDGKKILWHVGDSLRRLQNTKKTKLRAWDCSKYAGCLNAASKKNGKLDCRECRKYLKNENICEELINDHLPNQTLVTKFCELWKKDDVEGFMKWIKSKE